MFSGSKPDSPVLSPHWPGILYTLLIYLIIREILLDIRGSRGEEVQRMETDNITLHPGYEGKTLKHCNKTQRERRIGTFTPFKMYLMFITDQVRVWTRTTPQYVYTLQYSVLKGI